MTRNNLDSHISWLLSSEVTPPVGVQAQVTIDFEDTGRLEEEEGVEEELSCPALSPVRNRLSPQTTNARFVRPPVPTAITQPVQLRQTPQALGIESMGKLASAQRSTRPGLVSQYQLATPASMTSSTASPSTLTQGYATLLRMTNGTPSSKAITDRLQSRFSRSFQTPQTPRQTPRPTIEAETVESVDLTGDSHSDLASRSSSTEIVFGEPTVVWREEEASRPEPVMRSSKKRKSDELPKRSPKKHQGQERSPFKARRVECTSLDGFIDIDDMVPSRSQPERPAPRPRTAQPSIEIPHTKDDVEEYQVTETISRVETRTRKSISRVPSVSDSVPTRRKYQSPNRLQGSQTNPTQAMPTGTPTKLKSDIQVARSPIPKGATSPLLKHIPTPQKRPKQRQEMTIQDSEDDDDEIILEDIKRASCSPRRSIKNIPLVIDKRKSLKWAEIPGFESSDSNLKIFQASTPRTGSPLRPISRNSVSSPHSRDSSTKVSPAPKPVPQMWSHPEPPSTLAADDRALVNCYLGSPTAIVIYSQRIVNLKNQNAIACADYLDMDEVPPQHLKDERKALLEMVKAYEKLVELAGLHRRLVTEKKGLARKICELLEDDLDASTQEERLSVVTRELRELEKAVWQQLDKSGAIKDGFGTGLDAETYPLPPEPSYKAHEAVPMASGSSTIGSAQIILQTQFPSLQQKSVSSSNQHNMETLPPRLSPRHDLADPVVLRYPASPSPMRRPAPVQSYANPPRLLSPKVDRANTSRGIKQPNFYRDPSHVDYGFDDDLDFDDIVMQEAELQQNSTAREETPDKIEDYGDSDEDGFLELAQEVEERQSLPGPTNATTRNKTQQTSRNFPPHKGSTLSKKTMYSHVDPAHASMLSFPWSADVKKALKDRFGLRGFRQNQLDAINATLSGKDAFILMPTGGGKSLCYQLPAVVTSGKTRGVTVVISPLLSLMSDQVDHLKKRHIQAFLLNGEKAKAERELVFNALREPFPDQFVQVLYVTPEMIGKSGALISALGELHRKKKLARIVIDEAHCVSQWGHDFRPDYKTLVEVRHKFPGVPFMALTATATENVKADCIHNLGMEGCEEYKQSFNRPNLYYEIRPKKGKGAVAAVLEGMTDLILNDYKGQTGIVYTLSRKNCEDLAEKLREKGIKAHHFHASMPPAEKQQVQRDWQAGVWQVVVATIAFGMGIDKPDVRFVIHHTLPKSLEGYYQETGRAGRDGKPSGCYLYYGYQDTTVLRRFIDDSDGNEEVKERQRETLNKMVQFCENRIDCRRADILAYFGESFSKEDCNNSCDNCNSDAVFEPMDMTKEAGAALRIVQQLQSRNVTLLHVVDILRGSTASKIKNQNHNQLEGYGCASNLPRGEVERLFTRLLMENALNEYNIFNKSGFATAYIRLGSNCRDFMTGRRKLRLMHKVSASPASGVKPMARMKRAPPPSTMLTSPVSPSTRRKKGDKRTVAQDEDTDDDANFVASDGHETEDAFEPVRHHTSRQERRAVDLGPPITTDKRMKELPDLHRDAVDHFVDEAKKLEEQIRNKNGNTKRYFTETDFREMAINWTVSLDDMREIPEINQENVSRYGTKFIRLIERFHDNYDEIMNQSNNRDIDQNHVNVIDLCSDDETTEDEDYVSQAEQPSKYFTPAIVHQFNQQVEVAQQLPQTSHQKPDPPKQNSRGNYRGKARSRGGRKASGRKSNGSASGSNTSRSRGGYGNPSVAKKAPAIRKSSGTWKKMSTSATSKSSNMMKPFGNQGGQGPGGSGGSGTGFFAMPTRS